MIKDSTEYGVPRLHLLEHEYARAVITAELTWIHAVCGDIAAGTLTWCRYG
ncbi:MAG: hypothetical protein JO285_03295 [Kutzneria sp.]|nr:hypothetical protein [Kutzneria sp.]